VPPQVEHHGLSVSHYLCDTTVAIRASFSAFEPEVTSNVCKLAVELNILTLSLFLAEI